MGFTGRHLIFLFLLLLFGFEVAGQTYLQTIRGTVRDAQSGALIQGAQVSIPAQREGISTTTDSLGNFRLEKTPPGRYVVRVDAPGYMSKTLPEILLVAGKELVLDFSLLPTTFTLKEITIRSTIHRDEAISTRQISAEETRRFPAAWLDPARVTVSFPGVVQADDGTNHLVIRGNSPNGILWRLEGVDILNPNHLPNAGTFSDRIAQSGGGTNILSMQLMENSVFSTGAWGAEYGNALAGVFDVSLRNGNNQKYEFTAQAGLIGLDVAAEGPLTRTGKSSFVANYRYSTVGLLDLAGVPLGDEEVNFQDLAFKLNFPLKKGRLSVFGMGGRSRNFFEGPREDSLQTAQKDLFDIRFRSTMGAAGINYERRLGSRALWRTALVGSGTSSRRNVDFWLTPTLNQATERDEILQNRISLRSYVRLFGAEKWWLDMGGMLTRIGFEQESRSRRAGTPDALAPRALADGSGWLLQPFAKLSVRLGRWQGDLGLHGMHYFLNSTTAVEPRLSFGQQEGRHRIRFGYGLHSQLQLPGTYFATLTDSQGGTVQPNVGLGFGKAHHFVLGYQWLFSPN